MLGIYYEVDVRAAWRDMMKLFALQLVPEHDSKFKYGKICDLNI